VVVCWTDLRLDGSSICLQFWSCYCLYNVSWVFSMRFWISVTQSTRSSPPCANVCDACNCGNAQYFIERGSDPSRRDLLSAFIEYPSDLQTFVLFHSENVAPAFVRRGWEGQVKIK